MIKRSAMKGNLALVSLIALSITLATPAAENQESQAPNADKKQLEAQAKQLIAQGKALEQQGKLAEARDKYVDALEVVPKGDALSAIKGIDDKEKQQVESLLSEAHRLYDTGKVQESVQQLRQGLGMKPAYPALHYDLALCFLKPGDRANAALQLDEAVGALPNRKERTELLEFQSTVLMGTAPPVANAEAKNTLAGFNEAYLEEDRDPGDTKAKGGGLCDQTKALSDAFPANAAIVFNSAKCAEEDAQPEVAARQLEDYIKLAPNALDRAEAALLQENLRSLAGLTGDSGKLVRQHYANAARYLDYRRYDRTMNEYQAAEHVLPVYSQTAWQLGLLYEAYGNTAKAREQFSRFQELTPDGARKSDAGFHLSNLDRRRAVYDANVDEAQDILSGLLLASMGLDTEGAKHKTKLSYRQWRWASHRYKEATRATVMIPEPYVERELNRARQDLDGASELFPLGAEAQELLALISLQGNNWPEAFRSYDAVASQGFPVSFFAQVNSAHDNKEVRATKVEIDADAVRLVYLSSYDPKKRVSAPPARPAGEDNLGNLVVSAAQPPDAQAEALTIRVDDLKGIETDKNFVVLRLAKDRIYLAPLNMLSEAPFEGGASRSFGNEYTRLFSRYLGYETAKLGKEGMTTGEKFRLGFEIARIGMSVGMMGVGAPAAYGSAMHLARLAHALQVYRTYRSVARGVRTADMADATTRLADDLQMSAAALERTTSDQQRAIAGTQFKVIPTQQIQLKFREKF
jgi:tetratricopeptide (TPR) repeat protein